MNKQFDCLKGGHSESTPLPTDAPADIAQLCGYRCGDKVGEVGPVWKINKQGKMI